jgi:pilus assembly protein CpaF
MTALGLGPLQPLLDDERITEVMVNGAGPVWIERAGTLSQSDVVVDHAAIELLIERVLTPVGRRVDRRVPFADARLADGSRVNVIIPPVALDGPCITIRRFRAEPRPLDELVVAPVGALLAWAVRARGNVLVSGGAGAGKTTLLNALAACIPPGQRVVTIEDAAELRLRADHVVRLEARPANAEGAGEVTIRDLVRNALRMRPDRIVVGEVRGHEALEMLQAMNTGHEGSLSTCHANSPVDALRRLETMVSLAGASLSPGAVREQIVASIDLVVQVARCSGGERHVAEIAEVVAGDPFTVRVVARHDRVVALPDRPVRASDSPPPDPRWLGP